MWRVGFLKFKHVEVKSVILFLERILKVQATETREEQSEVGDSVIQNGIS